LSVFVVFLCCNEWHRLHINVRRSVPVHFAGVPRAGPARPARRCGLLQQFLSGLDMDMSFFR